MKVMLVGSGAVGEAYAILLSRADPGAKWLKRLVIADYDQKRAEYVSRRVGDEKRFPAVGLDAANRRNIVQAAKQWEIDLIMNGCPQHYNPSIFEAAFDAGCHYMDMAMTLSTRDPDQPFSRVGVMLGDYQYERHFAWKEKKLSALLGMGADPGISEVFARYAEKHLFDEIDEIGIRDGSGMTLDGHKYAMAFSVWSVLEECLNPPVYWEKETGYYVTEPMSGSEIFDFPEIGPLEVVSVEHEEVINIPRWINKGLKKVSFKISLGKNLMDSLRMLNDMGLASAEPVEVKGVWVSPRDVVAACLPNPHEIGHLMKGKICVGTLVTGKKDGKPREVYIYQILDNETCMNIYGCQAIAVQTAIGSALATELFAYGIWKKWGVYPPEAFEPEPFLEKIKEYGFIHQIKDSWATGESLY